VRPSSRECVHFIRQSCEAYYWEREDAVRESLELLRLDLIPEDRPSRAMSSAPPKLPAGKALCAQQSCFCPRVFHLRSSRGHGRAQREPIHRWGGAQGYEAIPRGIRSSTPQSFAHIPTDRSRRFRFAWSRACSPNVRRTALLRSDARLHVISRPLSGWRTHRNGAIDIRRSHISPGLVSCWNCNRDSDLGHFSKFRNKRSFLSISGRSELSCVFPPRVYDRVDGSAEFLVRSCICPR
jgi:hypothetical protein